MLGSIMLHNFWHDWHFIFNIEWWIKLALMALLRKTAIPFSLQNLLIYLILWLLKSFEVADEPQSWKFQERRVLNP